MAATLPQAWRLCQRLDAEYDARLRPRQAEETNEARARATTDG